MASDDQCRCAFCGEIVPRLPNGFAIAAGVSFPYQPQNPVTTGSMTISFPPSIDPAHVAIATCTHGYTVCAVCKFPAP